MDILILLATLFICFASGVPIAFSLGIAALVGALWIGIPIEAVMLKISDGVSKFAMLTIPFFVLAGAIMAEGGMARRLVAFANVLIGLVRLRGGLSIVNVVATTFLSGISGSSVADTSAIGSVLIPQMEKNGYSRVFATNVTISASVQAILVPPSHNAVIYSLATGGTISIISLFMAGVIPGLLLGLALVLLCLGFAYRDGHPKGEAMPLRQAVKLSIEAIWGLGTIVIIIGGILGGVFTAIEAGAVACLYAFFVTMGRGGAAMELAEDLQLVGGGGSRIGDPGGEADGPAGGVADGLVRDAGMQAGDGHLPALGVGFEDGEVGDQARRPLCRDAQALAVVTAFAMSRQRASGSRGSLPVSTAARPWRYGIDRGASTIARTTAALETASP